MNTQRIGMHTVSQRDNLTEKEIRTYKLITTYVKEPNSKEWTY